MPFTASGGCSVLDYSRTLALSLCAMLAKVFRISPLNISRIMDMVFWFSCHILDGPANAKITHCNFFLSSYLLNVATCSNWSTCSSGPSLGGPPTVGVTQGWCRITGADWPKMVWAAAQWRYVECGLLPSTSAKNKHYKSLWQFIHRVPRSALIGQPLHKIAEKLQWLM